MTQEKDDKHNLTIQFKTETDFNQIFTDKIPLEKLANIWNDEDEQYTVEELYKIREWLYSISDVILHVMDKYQQQGKEIEQTTITLKPIVKHDNKESHFIRPSEYRRAS